MARTDRAMNDELGGGRVPRQEGPLSGVRILDFSRQFADAIGTRILAAFGAEVLRAEWPEPPGLDFIRMTFPADGIPGINRGGMFNGANIGKLSFTLNMATEDGRALALRLAAISDVVYDNMTPRVMKNWGLDYASLQAVKQDIICVSCSGFGHTGPSAEYRSYGSPSQGHTGIVGLAGTSGRPPAGWSFQIGDSHAGLMNALTVMMALHYHRNTGSGCFIDSAQTQLNVTLLSELLLDFAANGQDRREADHPPGNRRPDRSWSPHNAYPCAGQDRWCVIAVASDKEWIRLVDALGRPDWALAARYETLSGRVADEESIDDHLAEWTRARDRYLVVSQLQSAGVRAGVVETIQDRLNWDTQLAHRGTYAVYDHAEVGPRRHETIGVRLSRRPYAVGRGAPLIGEHNDYVFHELLGLSAEEVAVLEARDVVRRPLATEAGADG